MGGGKGSPPPPPDPVATANAQGAANREAALASLETSMIGQQTPFGTLRYEKIGQSEAGNPQYRAITELSPQQQQLLGLQTQGQLSLGQLGVDQLGRIQDSVAQPFSYDGIASVTPDEAYRAQILNSIVTRNQPFMDRERQALVTSLANQGITDPGSQAYITAIDEINRRQNDFMLGADVTAANALNQEFARDMSARQQAIQERAYLRDRPLSEMSAFMSGAQPQMPQFGSTPVMNQQPADITGPTYAAYQGNLAAWQQGQQNNNAMMGGLFGLGAAGLGAWGLSSMGSAPVSQGLPFLP